jgi:DNA-binding GntR family transcriptional regulator
VARHEKIVDAIEARDPEAASAAMSAVIVRGVGNAADRFVT